MDGFPARFKTMAEKKKDKKFIQNMKMDKGAFTKKAVKGLLCTAPGQRLGKS